MFTHLRLLKKFDEETSKFYAAQVILAFEYLHNIGIIYRDLKPENILLQCDGYLKITDFGFCKKINRNRTYTFCGTPEYVAPEIIMHKGYSFSSDWWSLGILVFEMNAGYAPFFDENQMQMFDYIVSGKFTSPKYFSQSLQNFIEALLIEPLKRIGCLKNGIADVKGHLWFNRLDWDLLWKKKMVPSYLPKVKSPSDISNFLAVQELELRSSSKNECVEDFEDFDCVIACETESQL